MSDVVRFMLNKHAVNGVLPEEVSRLMRDFVRCADWIQGALEYSEGTHNLQDVLVRLLEDRDTHFWPGDRCFVITEIMWFPRKNVLNLWLFGGAKGALGELRNMIAPMEAFGKACGCSGVTFSGRRGWVKTFMAKDKGYRQTAVSMAKEI